MTGRKEGVSCETCRHWDWLREGLGWCGSEDGRTTLGVPKETTNVERETTRPDHWCRFHEPFAANGKGGD